MVSERRNELIAEMLHRVHFIEKWGRGIKLILSKEPDAEFSEVGTKFITTFKRKSYYEDKTGVERSVKKVGQKGRESTEKIRRKYGENTEKIILAIAGNQFIKTREIADRTKLSQSTVEKTVAKLKKAGILKRIGPDKGGYWEVVKK